MPERFSPLKMIPQKWNFSPGSLIDFTLEFKGKRGAFTVCRIYFAEGIFEENRHGDVI